MAMAAPAISLAFSAGIPLTHRPNGWDAADPMAEPAWGHALGGRACGRTGTTSFHPFTKGDAYGLSMR